MTIVLVHGSPGEGRSWNRVAKHLDGLGALLTPNLPGYGGSAPVNTDAAGHTAAMAGAIAAVIAAEPEPVWLCAHSYGGNVALHAALMNPARIRGLLLFEPVFMRGLELADDRATYEATSRFFLDYLGRVDAREQQAVGRMIDFWFGAGAFTKLPEPVQQFLDGAAPKNAADVRGSFAESLTREDLARLSRPARIVYGGASPAVAEAIARALASLLPQAEVGELPGATHGMLDSHGAEVALEIRNFCQR